MSGAEEHPKPEVPKGLRDAVARAWREDPEGMAENVERLKRQDFNPLAVIQRGIEEAPDAQ